MSTKSSVRTLRVVIRYRDREPITMELTKKTLPRIIGRGYLQKKLQLLPSLLRGISRRHLRIEFREDVPHGRFWIVDLNSSNGTIVQPFGDQARPRRYRNESFSIPGRIHIRLPSHSHKSDDKGGDDNVLIEMTDSDFQDMTSTEPLVGSLADWESLLGYLSTIQAAHLTGMPGVGKSWLAERLASSGIWQRQRERQLGDVLVVRVDGRDVREDKLGVWRDLASQMLIGLGDALLSHGRFDLEERVQSALKYLRADWIEKIREVTRAFLMALGPVIKEGNLRLIFIFDDFDQVYAKLESQMLYKLYQVHQKREFIGRVSFVIITREPLANLRQDINLDEVRRFNQLMPSKTIVLDCLQRDEFDLVMDHLAAGTYLAGSNAADTLYHFSGGHPALAKELYKWLSVNGFLNQPDIWHEELDKLDVVEKMSKSCRQIWRHLTDEQRRALVEYVNNTPANLATLDTLHELSIIRPDGKFFSPIFRECVPAFHERDRLKDRGLRIDLGKRRAFFNGQDITDTIKGDIAKKVLFYMYEHRNQLCTYKQLYTNCWSGIYDESCKGTVQRTVTRLREQVDSNKEYILNEAKRGYRLEIEE